MGAMCTGGPWWQVEEYTRAAKTVMIIEDSNHKKDVVLANLRAYHKFVTPGSFFLVQDTYVDQFGQGSHGPHGAVREFLASEGKDLFVIDRGREYFLFSQHSNGWLYRKEGQPAAADG